MPEPPKNDTPVEKGVIPRRHLIDRRLLWESIVSRPGSDRPVLHRDTGPRRVPESVGAGPSRGSIEPGTPSQWAEDLGQYILAAQPILPHRLASAPRAGCGGIIEGMRVFDDRMSGRHRWGNGSGRLSSRSSALPSR
jgi:hypothetical protein